MSTERNYNLDLLALAKIHDRSVEFQYKHDGVTAWRYVTVEKIEHKQDHYYITTVDHGTDDEYRQFRLDRIVGDVHII